MMQIKTLSLIFSFSVIAVNAQVYNPNDTNLRMSGTSKTSSIGKLDMTVGTTGTANYIPKFTASGIQTNSLLSDSGNDKIIQTATFGPSTVGDESKYIFGISGVNGAGIGSKKVTFNTADLIMYAQYGHNNSIEIGRFTATGKLGIGTNNPIGKLDIFTGLSGATSSIADITTGTISFGNNGSATAIPTIFSKSSNSVGLSLFTGTNDTNVSPDMRFVIMEEDGTDFTTLTTSAFRFSRFNIALFDILRNGNVGIGTTTPTLGRLQVEGSTNDVIVARNSTATGTSSINSTSSDGLYGIAFGVTNPSFVTTPSFGVAGDSYLRASINSKDLNIINSSNTNGNIKFLTSLSGGNPVERMRISANGSVGIGANSPVGKFDVNTGTALVITNPVSSLPNGTISFGNGSASGAVPNIVGRSNNSVGLQIMAGTNDINTSPDMSFNVRKNDNSDFTTLTTPAFRFSRFGTLLMDINRNGNIGVMSTPVVSPNNTSLGFVNGSNIQSRTVVPQLALSSNIDGDWYNATYKGTGYAAQIVIDPANMDGGANGISFNLAPSGTVGAPITWQRAMTIIANGNIGIGTRTPTSKLTVAGNINSREVKVTVDAGADFVFENNYNLPSLDSVAKFIIENKHLPEIASADEMKKEGINLSEMNIKLLQKIEELTLYVIEQKKEMERQNKIIEQLAEKLKIVHIK